DDFRDHVAQIDERRRTRLLAAEAREIADNLARPPGLRFHERHFVEQLRAEQRMTLEKLRGAENALQRVVELVRDAGNEQADGGQPLLADDLTLQRLQHLANLALL